MEMQVSISHLNEFAAMFWKHVKTAKVFAFYGYLGAGKTTIITALCKYKGVLNNMSSPTFSIINEYDYHKKEGVEKIFHIDLYRLKDAEEAINAGVEECINSGSLCFVEWPEKAPELFDEETWHISIEPVDENIRRIKIYHSV